jgi:hypothetical protein
MSRARRRYLEGELTERERDARVALHRALRRTLCAREAGAAPTDDLRAELAAAPRLGVGVREARRHRERPGFGERR